MAGILNISRKRFLHSRDCSLKLQRVINSFKTCLVSDEILNMRKQKSSWSLRSVFHILTEELVSKDLFSISALLEVSYKKRAQKPFIYLKDVQKSQRSLSQTKYAFLGWSKISPHDWTIWSNFVLVKVVFEILSNQFVFVWLQNYSLEKFMLWTDASFKHGWLRLGTYTSMCIVIICLTCKCVEHPTPTKASSAGCVPGELNDILGKV